MKFVVLLNVFPKSIAEQLLVKGDEYQPQLIAEEYKEATILFGGVFSPPPSHLALLSTFSCSLPPPPPPPPPSPHKTNCYF